MSEMRVQASWIDRGHGLMQAELSGAQAQSRAVRVRESMPGTGPQACLAPLPSTLFKTSNVVLGHVRLRCAWQVLKHRSMIEERANQTGNEDASTLRRAWQ